MSLRPLAPDLPTTQSRPAGHLCWICWISTSRCPRAFFEAAEGCENAVAPSELPIRVAGVLPLAHLGSRFSPVEQEVAS